LFRCFDNAIRLVNHHYRIKKSFIVVAGRDSGRSLLSVLVVGPLEMTDRGSRNLLVRVASPITLKLTSAKNDGSGRGVDNNSFKVYDLSRSGDGMWMRLSLRLVHVDDVTGLSV
jgi:hypothetical protein